MYLRAKRVVWFEGPFYDQVLSLVLQTEEGSVDPLGGGLVRPYRAFCVPARVSRDTYQRGRGEGLGIVVVDVLHRSFASSFWIQGTQYELCCRHLEEGTQREARSR